MPYDPSWPMHLDPQVGQVLDRRALVEGAASSGDSWTPLIAACLAVGKPSKREREVLGAVLGSRGVAGFDKSMSEKKACVAAEAAGLDQVAFCQGLLAARGVKALPGAIARIGGPAVFSTLDHQRALELRVGRGLPPGMGQLEALERLGLLGTKKLASDQHVAELAKLPTRIGLTLIFDGKPDRMSPPVFIAPNLGLFTAGDVAGLAFETTGSPVELSLEALAPLGEWSHLKRLSLRQTTLAQLSLAELTELRTLVPTLSTLVLTSAPEGDWRACWPGLDLRLGRDERSAP